MSTNLTITGLACLILLCGPSFAQQEVDFSKAYVVPELSNTNSITFGGVNPSWTSDVYQVRMVLNESYNLILNDALVEDSPAQSMEQSLRNTTWTGVYNINASSYETTLILKIVQDGYVAGEITHFEVGDYMQARVAGDILTQFLIGGKYVDEDALSAQALAALPPNTPNRQLIRIKRVRGLQFASPPGSTGWSQNREYRLILEGDSLTGSVGIPNDKYGDGDATSSNGNVSLTLKTSE